VLKIWRARSGPATAAAPGTVCAAAADGIVVACGTGTLRILELQRAGGRRLPAQAFLSGFRLARGASFGTKHG
jgi:methionyl-tRNA formyltransferase